MYKRRLQDQEEGIIWVDEINYSRNAHHPDSQGWNHLKAKKARLDANKAMR